MKQYFFLLLCFIAFRCTSVHSLSYNGVTLLSLLRHWSSVPPSIKSSWNASDSTPCLWVGVKCDNAHNVIYLILADYKIYGQLGPQIAKLSHLMTIDLSLNNFSGNIPPELSNCSLLQTMNFSTNMFTGSIPDSLLNLNNLSSLDLSSNLLSGEIPGSLSQIPHLEYLFLNNNNLSGSISTNIGNAINLLQLDLNNNKLSGTIPSSIGNCSKLEVLYLDSNQLEGVLPESLNNLENVVYLNVSMNRLSGTIPLGLGGCRNLETLDLSYNSFSGGIPRGLGNCTSLTDFIAVKSDLTGKIPSSLGQLGLLSTLFLSDNHLTGKIPPEIGNCRSLMVLHLQFNQLDGEIPSELGMVSELRDLQLFTNHLTGEIPLSIWKIPNLEQVIVYNNSLSGELPVEMTELKQLINISLFNNQFSGVIPQSLGINSSLVELEFTNNRFTAKIPPNLCFGKKLVKLNLGLNQLQGSIPADVGSCTTLRRLILEQNYLTGVLPEFARNPNLLHIDVSNNNISGSVPSSTGNLVNLRTFILAHNNLEGPLPPELTNCSKVEHFDVSFNFLNGSFPSSLRSLIRLSKLYLRENQFSGGIKVILSEFEKLEEIQLGGNSFGGVIPESIGHMRNHLHTLNLSANKLRGDVPSEIQELKSLQHLDISFNNLTGNITAIAKLTLVEVNISNNFFVGPVPMRLMMLLNSSPSSFLGNPGLCVSFSLPDGLTSNLKTCDCDLKSTSQRGLSHAIIAMIAIGSSLFVVFLLLGLFHLCCRQLKQDVAKEVLSPLLAKVMEATENLNEKYIVGRGAHGVVYKAQLDTNQTFAVKKVPFAGDTWKSSSMVREIQTIGKIRHRNLVRLEEFWFEKNYGIILYRYMQNGSLHDVLHEMKPPPDIQWTARYRIAVGIANGLAYLHYDCDPAIVHRDIKPGNVLLDSDMEAHISDFGIAKLLDQSSASIQSISIPGTNGYIAPEIAYTTVYRRECDVYSYGVVLLELITRKKAVDPSFVEETDIVGWVRSIWCNTGEISGIIDSSLMEELLNSEMKQITQMLLVALRCTEKEPDKRPTMRNVIKQLLDAKI